MTTPRALAVGLLSTVLLASTPPKTDAPDPEALMRSGHFKKARPLVEERFRVGIPDEEIGKRAFASVDALVDFIAAESGQ